MEMDGKKKRKTIRFSNEKLKPGTKIKRISPTYHVAESQTEPGLTTS